MVTEHVLTRMRHGSLLRGFEAWTSLVSERKRLRAVVSKSLRRMTRGLLYSAFCTWSASAADEREQRQRKDGDARRAGKLRSAETKLESSLAGSKRGASGVAQLRELVALTAHGPAAGFLRISPSLARGLSYYTGPIFEVKSPQLAGSIAAGGRYDGLVGIFLGRRIPAVGFSLGLERLEVVLEALGLQPSIEDTAPQVMVARFGDDLAATMGLASFLREAGLRVDVFPDSARLGKQFKAAQQRGIRFVALMGPDELAEGLVSIKDLSSGEQQRVTREDAVAAIIG